MKKGDTIQTADKAIILCGDPGTRKTTLALHFPKPYFLDCDGNMAAPVEQTGKRDFLYDSGSRDDDNNLIHPIDRFNWCIKCLNQAILSPDVRTIVIDSLTTFTEYIIAEVKRQEYGAIATNEQAKDAVDAKPFRVQDWGKFAAIVAKLFGSLRTCGKILVVIAHNIVDKDEADARYKMFLNIPGKNKTTFSGLFTDCWNTTYNITGVGANAKQEFVVRTQPMTESDHRGVKSSFKDAGAIVPLSKMYEIVAKL